MALFPGLPRWADTRKVKPLWILPKQETVSGSGISWAICKSAPCSRQITMPASHHSVCYRPDALPATQPTASKHWRHSCNETQQKIEPCNLTTYIWMQTVKRTPLRTLVTSSWSEYTRCGHYYTWLLIALGLSKTLLAVVQSDLDVRKVFFSSEING